MIALQTSKECLCVAFLGVEVILAIFDWSQRLLSIDIGCVLVVFLANQRRILGDWVFYFEGKLIHSTPLHWLSLGIVLPDFDHIQNIQVTADT